MAEDYNKDQEQNYEASHRPETYYTSVAYFQSTDDTESFDRMKERGDYTGILQEASYYDEGIAPDLSETFKKPCNYRGDDVLIEDDQYAVVYNASVGGTYDIMRKVTKEEILDNIREYGLDSDATEDVKKLAYEDAAQQLADSEKSNVLTMPNGEKLDFQYSEERNQVDVGKMTPKGMDVQYIFDYDISRSPQRNISTIQDELSHYDEFRLLSDEEVEQREMTGIRWRLYKSKLEMPSGDVLTPEYDQKKDTLNVAYTTEDGKPEIFSTKYRHEVSAIENENVLWEKFAGMKQYQAKQEEKTSKDGQKAEVPHEDTQTSLAKEQAVDERKEETKMFNMYSDMKQKHPGVLLLFHSGNFYKSYMDDAGKVSEILGTEMSSDKKQRDLDGKPLQMTRFPSYSLDTYLPRLIRAGERIAIVDELTTPKEEKKQHEVVDNPKEEARPIREDGNPHTDIGAAATSLAATGTVSQQEAEKMAISAAEEQTHREYHEKKSEQEAAEKKAAAKPSGSVAPDMTSYQAAIVGAALAYAAEHGGVVSNIGGKGNPKFVGRDGVQLSPYNSMLMMMQSDRNAWRTNAYVYSFDSAKADGMAVKKGEKSLPLNWVHWYYEKNVAKPGDKEAKISTKDFYKLSDEEKKAYSSKRENITMNVFNVDQTSLPSGEEGYKSYQKLLSSDGSALEPFTEFDHNDVLKRNKELEKKTPKTIVFWKTGDTFKAYDASARALAKNTGLEKVTEDVNGKKVSSVTFSADKHPSVFASVNKAGWSITVMDTDRSAAYHMKKPLDADKIGGHVQALATKVGMGAGFKVDRMLKEVPSHYDAEADRVVFSGLGRTPYYDAADTIEQVNGIYRSVVEAIGDRRRLDRANRIAMIPGDSAKYDTLVRDLSAAVLMGRDGLPSKLSGESMRNIDFFRQELQDNPCTVNIIAKHVNETVESIDRHERGKAVNYSVVRGQHYSNYSMKDYSVISKVNDIPAKETKEMVIIYDGKKKHADVILPADASLSTEKGMRKDRIEKALGKQGYTDVALYNAGGANGLKAVNGYFMGKDVEVGRLNQYNIVKVKTVDLSKELNLSKNISEGKGISAIKGNDGKYVFVLRPAGESRFTIRPIGGSLDMKKFFNVLKSPSSAENRKQVLSTLEDKYYTLAQAHPELKVDVLTPKYDNSLDLSRLERVVKNGDTVKTYKPNIWTDKDDKTKHYIVSYVDDKFMKREISKSQFENLFFVSDMQRYKYALAANVFAEELGVKTAKSESLANGTDQSDGIGEDASGKLDISSTTGSTADADGNGVADDQENLAAANKESQTVSRGRGH